MNIESSLQELFHLESILLDLTIFNIGCYCMFLIFVVVFDHVKAKIFLKHFFKVCFLCHIYIYEAEEAIKQS